MNEVLPQKARAVWNREIGESEIEKKVCVCVWHFLIDVRCIMKTKEMMRLKHIDA